MTRPIGYFVHHQGRGHAERCAAIAAALPATRPLTVFCARDDIFPPLPRRTTLVRLPSLFESGGDEAPAMAGLPTPDTLHCAPLGWPGIRRAMAAIAQWFGDADPALMIADVSAEVAQLARICSVPHVKVLQHGNRGDAGHRAAYDGAVGLLAPFHEALAQPEWGAAMRARTLFAGGLGLADGPAHADGAAGRAEARRRIGLAADAEMILVVSGGGGSGFAQAPIAVGARTLPDARWVTIGAIQRDWHATEPNNVEHRGWVSDAADFIAAADLVVSSTGNTTCHEVLAAGRPWLAVPEWRYFDEQHRKAEALAAAGAAHVLPHLPSSPLAWLDAVAAARATHDARRQRALLDAAPAAKTADWLEALIDRLWAGARPAVRPTACPVAPVPALGAA